MWNLHDCVISQLIVQSSDWILSRLCSKIISICNRHTREFVLWTGTISTLGLYLTNNDVMGFTLSNIHVVTIVYENVLSHIYQRFQEIQRLYHLGLKTRNILEIITYLLLLFWIVHRVCQRAGFDHPPVRFTSLVNRAFIVSAIRYINVSAVWDFGETALKNKVKSQLHLHCVVRDVKL